MVRRIIRWLLPTVCCTALCGCASNRSWENHLIFYPQRYPRGNWETDNLKVEDVWFTTADGVKLHGWYAAREDPRAVVIFAHGNAGNVTHRQFMLRLWNQRLHSSILMFDYRGYGRSEGSPDEAGLYADARAAHAWLAERAQLKPAEIVVMGESLGGAVAVDLAAELGARGLVLVSTFSTMPDVAAYHVPWLPVRRIMQNRFESVNKIGNYHGPLLESHGTADTVVPIDSARTLFAAANGPKRWVQIPDGGHNDPPTSQLIDAFDEFLTQLPPMRR